MPFFEVIYCILLNNNMAAVQKFVFGFQLTDALSDGPV
jgi:hypothetical protein